MSLPIETSAVKPYEREVWAAVRQAAAHPEFVHLSEVAANPVAAQNLTTTSEINHPTWHDLNPVIRIAKFRLVEVPE